MKFLHLVVFLLTLSSVEAQTPVYLGFVSHNEWSDNYDYENNSSDYWLVTNIAQDIADTIIAKGARWNIQVDANFILGTLNHENGASNANDFLEWASSSMALDVDCHNHFDTAAPHIGDNPYNYPDLAHLLDSCGVTLNQDVVGGYTWLASDGENWTQFLNPVQGNTFPSFSWYPNILWGAASPGHTNDIDDFGIWSPTSPMSILSFTQQNPGSNLIHIGNGCKDDMAYSITPSNNTLMNTTSEVIANIKNIADQINAQAPVTNEMYTANIMLNFRDFPNATVVPSFADSIAKIIDGLQSYVDSGKIVWATLAEKYMIWNSSHTANDSFLFACEDFALELNEQTQSDIQLLYPNPVGQYIAVDGLQVEKVKSFAVLTATGAVMKHVRGYENQIDVSHLKSGVYLLRVEYPEHIETLRFVKN